MAPLLETNDTHDERQQLTKQSEANFCRDNGGEPSTRVLKLNVMKQAGQEEEEQQEQHNADAPDDDGAICDSQQTATFATDSLKLIGHLLVAIVGSLAWLLIKLACQLLLAGDNQAGDRGRDQEDESAAAAEEEEENVKMCREQQRRAERRPTDPLSNSSSSEELVIIGADNNGITSAVLGPSESRHKAAPTSQEKINR